MTPPGDGVDFRPAREAVRRLAAELPMRVADAVMQHAIEVIHTGSPEGPRPGTPITHTGYLARSMDVRRVAARAAELVVTAPYAAAVEFGAAPHMPPWPPLLRWVRRKLQLEGRLAEQVTRRIQDKIAREGTEAQPYLRPAVAAVQARLDDLARSVAREVGLSE